MPTTPNMSLVQPTPSLTPGPTWAEMINTINDLIDAHDHTSGRGIRINQAGILINGDLTLNGFMLEEVKALVLDEYGSIPATSDTLKSIFVYAGDVYYRNASGQVVQLTSGGSLALPGTGAISWKQVTVYPYSIVAGDAQKILGIDCSSARVLTLPAASAGGGIYTGIKDYLKLSMTNPITLNAGVSDLIEGAASVSLANEAAAWNLISDGVSNWYFV